MWSKWKPRPRTDCFEVEASGLGLTNVLTAFLALGAFTAVAFVIMLLENMIKSTNLGGSKKRNYVGKVESTFSAK